MILVDIELALVTVDACLQDCVGNRLPLCNTGRFNGSRQHIDRVVVFKRAVFGLVAVVSVFKLLHKLRAVRVGDDEVGNCIRAVADRLIQSVIVFDDSER